MEDADAAEVALRAIAALGVSVAIDDLGTGPRLTGPSEALQPARFQGGPDLPGRYGSRREDDAIVASTINLAGAVGAVCIAEGVETPEQHGALVALGDYAQCFLFGRPVPAEALAQALTDCPFLRRPRPHGRSCRIDTPHTLKRNSTTSPSAIT
jgi:EAL domain-containing protein (putative c-di-GMP-specific phosphodiesterase class I)